MVPLPHQYYEDTKTSHSPSFFLCVQQEVPPYRILLFVIALAISFQAKPAAQKAGADLYTALHPLAVLLYKMEL